MPGCPHCSPGAGTTPRLQGLLETLAGMWQAHGEPPLHRSPTYCWRRSPNARQVRDEQKRRADALQQKLDALKAVENGARSSDGEN